jgi:hypothetical protein
VFGREAGQAFLKFQRKLFARQIEEDEVHQ